MKSFSIKSNLLSIVTGIALAILLFLSTSLIPKAAAEDWCEAPSGCNFVGCRTITHPTGPDTKVCKFRDVNGQACGGSPACGTAPGSGGGGGGVVEPESGPEV